MKKLRKAIIKDPFKASDLSRFKIPMACEECIHFGIKSSICSLGYNSKNHLASEQKKDFELSGRIAICRFHEIV
jgi:hypothetical protein